MTFPMYFSRIFRKPSPSRSSRINGRRASWTRDVASGSDCGASLERAEGNSPGSIRTEQFSPGASLDNNAILDLLGASADSTREASVRERNQSPGHIDRADLMAALKNQYYQALESPHALPSAPWLSSTLPQQDDAWTLFSAGEDRRDDMSAPLGDLLSDIEKVEDAFGPLRRGASDVGQPEEIPEVLRLFAPPEYHMTAARRAAAVPPTVARRDHHTLAIDSPLAVLDHSSNRTNSE